MKVEARPAPLIGNRAIRIRESGEEPPLVFLFSSLHAGTMSKLWPMLRYVLEINKLLQTQACAVSP
jgi:hypothetical protein